jgi:hypothetical protein
MQPLRASMEALKDTAHAPSGRNPDDAMKNSSERKVAARGRQNVGKCARTIRMLLTILAVLSLALGGTCLAGGPTLDVASEDGD